MNIITPRAIISYPNLFEPRAAVAGAEKKYSCTFVFPEDTDISSLKKAAIKVAKEEWGDDLAGAEIRSLETQHAAANFLVADDSGLRIRLPWRDAPEVISSKGYPEGSTYINARSSNPPGVVSLLPDPHNDNKPASIINARGDIRFKDGTVKEGVREVYAGAIGKGLLSVYAYDTQGNMGVSFGLSGVQVVDDGERLDGRANAEDAFDADMEAAADLSDLTGEDGEEDELSDLIG